MPSAAAEEPGFDSQKDVLTPHDRVGSRFANGYSIREEGGNRTNMQKNELMAAFTGYVYFPTNEQTADAALTRLWEALEQAGINADNIDFGKCELRDSDGNTQSVFRQP